MRRCIIGAALVAALGVGLTLAFAEKPGAPAAARVDEEAIRKTIDAYAAAYNKGDVDKLMTYWADGAEFVDEDGGVTRGKDALAAQFRRVLTEHKGRTLRIKVGSLRLLRPDLAMLDGTAEFKNPDGTGDTGPFAVVWTRTDGKWEILSVRDLPGDAEPDANPSAAQLRQLDWLLGEWGYKDKETVITFSCRRTEKKSFLLIQQSVMVKGEEVLSLTQVIGWDPLRQQFRSWVFDSAGGFGEGSWERQGNEWVVAMDGVRSDGRSASGVNTWRYVDANSFEWAATDREIDGEPAPDMKVRYTRQTGKK
jgi:uncharacterized protein (TIGR02246 family)